MVEQNAVPVEGRLRALEMEIKLCKQQITGVNRARVSISASVFTSTSLAFLNRLLECFLFKLQREVKQRFDVARKELESMKYHPLRDYKSIRSGDQASNAKRKKLKTSINCKFYETFPHFFLHLGSILLQPKWVVKTNV